MRVPLPNLSRFPLRLLAVLPLILSGCQRSSPDSRTEAVEPAQVVPMDRGNLRVSGPYRHENLTVFLVHGKDSTSEDFITLDEGLKSGTVVLSEQGATVASESTDGNAVRQALAGDARNTSQVSEQRGAQIEAVQNDAQQTVQSNIGQSFAQQGGATVNTLMVENKSDRPVYIQAGDIVKGGQQDRTIGVDIVIAPNSGQVPLEAFCVEQGRWANRSSDATLAGQFVGNEYALNSKALKLAVRHSKSQTEVWQNVAKIQTDLSENVATPVNDASSPTSLQLALENEALMENVDGYLKNLEQLVTEHDDAIGYAFAINGQLNAGDVYASNKLFKKLWPKLLHASATEAIAELEGKTAEETCGVADVIACFEDADQGKATAQDLENGVKSVSRESDRNLLFETRLGEVSLRKNYLTK